MTTEEENPFDTFDEVAAIYAFCHATFGEAGLRELLAMVDTDKEGLLRDAAELAEMGLLKASDIVAEQAATAPETSLENPHPPETADWRDWNRRHHQDFTGFYLDDEDRRQRAKKLRC
jgi:hypothetical protein